MADDVELPKSAKKPGYDYAQKVGKDVQDSGKAKAAYNRDLVSRYSKPELDEDRANERSAGAREASADNPLSRAKATVDKYTARESKFRHMNEDRDLTDKAKMLDRGSQQTGIPSFKRGGTMKRSGKARLHRGEKAAGRSSRGR